MKATIHQNHVNSLHSDALTTPAPRLAVPDRACGLRLIAAHRRPRECRSAVGAAARGRKAKVWRLHFISKYSKLNFNLRFAIPFCSKIS
jgi:hypothetical protein